MMEAKKGKLIQGVARKMHQDQEKMAKIRQTFQTQRWLEKLIGMIVI